MTYETGKTWTPGLDNDGRTLGDAYEAIPQRTSPLGGCQDMKASRKNDHALPLFDLECLHLLLGRGFSLQDEAFVLGYWMGASHNILQLQGAICHLVSRIAYSSRETFGVEEFRSFHMGFEFGQEVSRGKLQSLNFKTLFDTTLGELRERLGIDKERLRQVMTREKALKMKKA